MRGNDGIPTSDQAINRIQTPEFFQAIEKDTKALDFNMSSCADFGSLLRSLVASKPDGCYLELGTGTGLSTAWIRNGMTPSGQLITIDHDPAVLAVAKTYLGADSRIQFYEAKGEDIIFKMRDENQQFDLIFADTWPGKFYLYDETLQLLKVGGIYIVDDLLPQLNWPDGHAEKVVQFKEKMRLNKHLHVVELAWSLGVLMATKKA